MPASPPPAHAVRPLHVGDELLGVRPGHDGHELPAVVAPVVQDLLGRVHQQRHRRVLPLRHGATIAAAAPARGRRLPRSRAWRPTACAGQALPAPAGRRPARWPSPAAPRRGACRRRAVRGAASAEIVGGLRARRRVADLVQARRSAPRAARGISGTSGISSGAPLSISASASATSVVAEVGQRGRVRGRPCAAGAAGVNLSKNRSSSTGTGMTSVLLRSAATSTTVCSSRSCSAAGSRAITLAAAASRLEAWYSPSAVMIRARRSRSASACRDIDRFMPSGSDTSLISTRSTRMPHGPSVGSSMIRRSSRFTRVALGEQLVHLGLADDRAQRGLRLLGDREHVVLHVDRRP